MSTTPGTEYLGIIQAVRNLGLLVTQPTIGQTTGGQHAADSEHYAGRAVDFGVGSQGAENVRAIYRAVLPYAQGSGHVVDELYFDPSGSGWKDGVNIGPIGGHSDHVHVGVRTGVDLSEAMGYPPLSATGDGGINPDTIYPDGGTGDWVWSDWIEREPLVTTLGKGTWLQTNREDGVLKAGATGGSPSGAINGADTDTAVYWRGTTLAAHEAIPGYRGGTSLLVSAEEAGAGQAKARREEQVYHAAGAADLNFKEPYPPELFELIDEADVILIPGGTTIEELGTGDIEPTGYGPYVQVEDVPGEVLDAWIVVSAQPSEAFGLSPGGSSARFIAYWRDSPPGLGPAVWDDGVAGATPVAEVYMDYDIHQVDGSLTTYKVHTRVVPLAGPWTDVSEYADPVLGNETIGEDCLVPPLTTGVNITTQGPVGRRYATAVLRVDPALFAADGWNVKLFANYDGVQDSAGEPPQYAFGQIADSNAFEEPSYSEYGDYPYPGYFYFKANIDLQPKVLLKLPRFRYLLSTGGPCPPRSRAISILTAEAGESKVSYQPRFNGGSRYTTAV